MVEKLIKLQLGQIPTVPVMAGNEGGEKPHRLPTLRKAVLASERQKMQDIQTIGLPEENHACCISSGTLQNSAK